MKQTTFWRSFLVILERLSNALILSLPFLVFDLFITTVQVNASAATRDYFLRLDDENDIPLINIFGGKITTYRKLAESVMQALSPFFLNMPGSWTAGASLPGGDFAVDGFEQLVSDIEGKYPFLPNDVAWRLARAYGTDTWVILGEAQSVDDLGQDFGAGVYAV